MNNDQKVIQFLKKKITSRLSERGELFNPFPKQLEFLKLTNKAKIVYWMGAHQTGKTTLTRNIVKAFSTGYYPSWWVGKKFNRATNGIIIGNSHVSVNSLLKSQLLGNFYTDFQGVIPFEAQKKLNSRGSLFDDKTNQCFIRYRGSSSVYSSIKFRTFNQGTMGIEGEGSIDWIWIDEMPQNDYLAVAFNRTIAVADSIVIMTATPEKNIISKLVEKFLFYPKGSPDEPKKLIPEGEVFEDRVYINSCWGDNPNITEEQKEAMRKLYLPHQLAVAEFGRPLIGASNVFQFSRNLYVISPILIKREWYLLNGMDVGINDPTAIVCIAYDQVEKHIYVYNVYKKNGLKPSEHVKNLKLINHNLKIPHLIDASANNRIIGETVKDMETVAKAYQTLGLNVRLAKKLLRDLREATIVKIYELIQNGKFTIFSNCESLIDEIESYRRGEDFAIIEGQDDHLIDALMYALNGLNYASNPNNINSDSLTRWF